MTTAHLLYEYIIEIDENKLLSRYDLDKSYKIVKILNKILYLHT